MDFSPNEFKVTIGICVKDSENLVKEAIESIGNQDFLHNNMEIIFVDDGSKDKTLSIIQENALKVHISYKLFHHDWHGLGYSRNVVLNNASGKYVIWVDGDMTLSKDFVRKQASFMEMNPKCGIAKGRYGIYETGIVGTLENMDFMTTNERSTEREGFAPLGAGGSIYRTATVKEVGSFDAKMEGSGEDADLEFRVRQAGWTLAITEAIFYERRRKTWKSLWNEYFWHGKGAFVQLEKNRQLIEPYKLLPPVAIIIAFSRVGTAYRLTRQRIALLLPVHYVFKRIAWTLGLASVFLNR